uniref:Uncharacterized protein n=1 Tax=Anguilla anguilla TaxID=7936 RepID=A0A0E9QR56_ANGAN
MRILVKRNGGVLILPRDKRQAPSKLCEQTSIQSI